MLILRPALLVNRQIHIYCNGHQFNVDTCNGTVQQSDCQLLEIDFQILPLDRTSVVIKTIFNSLPNRSRTFSRCSTVRPVLDGTTRIFLRNTAGILNSFAAPPDIESIPPYLYGRFASTGCRSPSCKREWIIKIGSQFHH